MTNDELLGTACPIIRDTGWAFYFTPATMARGTELGLDYIQFYVMGRGGVLGDVEGTSVASAFGYFNPTLVESTWSAGKAVIAPRAAATEYMACCGNHGREKLSDVAGLDGFVAAASAVNDAADPTALTLYAAISTEPLADDAPAKAMQLLTVLREFRGSAHLLALRASGVDSKTAHFISRPNDIGMFGWTEADKPEITDATLAAKHDAELLTDRLVAPAYDVLDDTARTAFVDGLHAINAALTAA
ncbi:MAG: hypothetical protein JWM34_1804 [Ilumatobacteraceae bacterium]|nr:hypothetical protein [Ilumatobacteraceae bacterium]